MADSGQLKIGDFGLSIDLDVDIDNPFIRKCRGTPNYIAPEIVDRQIPTDKCDMWLLGVLLYRIVVGQPPFDSQSLKTTLTRVRAVDFVIPEKVRNTYPIVCDIIVRLLVADPLLRPSAQELIRLYPQLASV